MHLENRILIMTKYTKSSWKIAILLEFNCVTQFDMAMCYTDCDKVTVKFGALIVFPSFPDGKKVLDQLVPASDHRVLGLRQEVFALRFWIFVFDTSEIKWHILQNLTVFIGWQYDCF